MTTRHRHIERGSRALIAMIHVQALPGTPMVRHAPDHIVSQAASEAELLAGAGFDAIIVENMHDVPYVHGAHGPETVAMMTRVVLAVRSVIGNAMPLGMQILSGGNRESLAAMHAAGETGRNGFIRCENFVYSHVADEGLLERAEAGPLLRYRRAIAADGDATVAGAGSGRTGGLRIFADIRKKHASHAITADTPITDMAEAAAFFGVDGLIITGAMTGRSADLDEISAVRSATNLPILVGSGVTPESVGPLFEAGADALIVGSFIKADGNWVNGPDRSRCDRIVGAANQVR